MIVMQIFAWLCLVGIIWAAYQTIAEWKFFKEFIREDWRDHDGCWSMFAVTTLAIMCWIIYLFLL